MQPAVALQAGWSDLLGALLMVAGAAALAAHALGFGRARAGPSHILRTYRPAEWCRQSAPGRLRPMDEEHQWQKLAAILERGFAQVGAAADLHTRAAEALEAIDKEVLALRADYSLGKALSSRPRDTQPIPAPAPAPLAA
jgi:hypothetical protein